MSWRLSHRLNLLRSPGWQLAAGCYPRWRERLDALAKEVLAPLELPLPGFLQTAPLRPYSNVRASAPPTCPGRRDEVCHYACGRLSNTSRRACFRPAPCEL